ncbi:MAG: aminomethyl-transferring glycine dehydrogenase subunit GcvPB [Candidatus Manganitrophus sp.]|nr:aminomethyl-transferring glycine dehydrogenase subunit GcvPB [Candidatus Manganitrophus sp.]
MPEKLIFEKSVPGRRGATFPTEALQGFSIDQVLPKKFQRQIPLPLPEVSENELMRHYTRLSHENYGVDTGFYPLGSCTMKYNPKINEDVARFPGFAQIHPLQPIETVQGALQLLYHLEKILAEIAGMARVSLQPVAGAQGELVGMLITRAYHQQQGRQRKKVVIPDSAHGTNPASAALAGYTIQTVHSNADGLIDVDDLAKVVDEETAAFMLTNPNTLGLFEREIEKIVRIVHDAGALMYLDGANLNALLGLTRPGDMGFDIVHFNLHKTFSTPHGGAGRGPGRSASRSGWSPISLRRRLKRRGKNIFSMNVAPNRSGGSTASTATSGSWSAPTPTSAGSGPRASLQLVETPSSTPTIFESSWKDRIRFRLTVPACTSSSSRPRSFERKESMPGISPNG